MGGLCRGSCVTGSSPAPELAVPCVHVYVCVHVLAMQCVCVHVYMNARVASEDLAKS